MMDGIRVSRGVGDSSVKTVVETCVHLQRIQNPGSKAASIDTLSRSSRVRCDPHCTSVGYMSIPNQCQTIEAR